MISIPPPGQITLEVPEDPSTDVVITLAGEIDVYDHAKLSDVAARSVATQRPVTVNCRELTFLDSSALILFVHLIRTQQRITIVAIQPEVQHLLIITGIDRFLHFED